MIVITVNRRDTSLITVLTGRDLIHQILLIYIYLRKVEMSMGCHKNRVRVCADVQAPWIIVSTIIYFIL